MTRKEILHNIEIIEDKLPFDIMTLDAGKRVFVNVSGLINEVKGILKQEDCGIIHCKNCKYFERDYMAMVDGIPLILGHEICTKWGDCCKTKEEGYCFMAEKREDQE